MAKEAPLLEVGGDDFYTNSFSVQAYTDHSRSLTINDVSQLDLTDHVMHSRFNIPIEHANYWFVFKIKNQSEQAIRRIVKFDEPYLLNADIYYQSATNNVDEKQWFRELNGLAIPVSERQLYNRLPSFLIPLAPGETKTIYLMMTTRLNLATVGIEVATPPIFILNEQIATGAYWLFFGISLAMLIYNLFLLITLRDRLYFYYVIYCATFLIFVAMYSGFDLFIINSASLHYAFTISIAFSIAGLIQFIRELLQTKSNLPRIDLIMKGLIAVYFIEAILTLINMDFYYLVVVLSMPTTIFLMFVNFFAFVKKIPLANYALFGLSWYMLGVLSIAGLNAGLFPYNTFTRYGFMLGSIIELFVFSIALAYRVHHLQLSENAMQAELYQAESQAKQKLEATVIERTAELTTMNKRLEHLSQVDGLTQLYNRHYFDKTIENEWGRLTRQQHPACLILCDLDFFKQYNDSYGHQAGDQCLIKVSRLIQKSIKRSSDFAARYGGEEFVLLLPESSIEAGMLVAKKIQASLKQSNIMHEHTNSKIVTMSFGIAHAIPSAEMTIEKLIKHADLALYQSKSDGRDCITVYK